jgi:NlpC/P60 family putative phage cell wall peptidase
MTSEVRMSPGAARSGADVVRVARGWIGTPYQHQASLKGVGTDCLGLVRGVWRELYGSDAETPPPYTRDWAEAGARETMLEAAERHLVGVSRIDPRPGDILIFRLRPGVAAKHAAILATPKTMIHAAEGAPAAEVPLSSWWRRRIAKVYAFPGIER